MNWLILVFFNIIFSSIVVTLTKRLLKDISPFQILIFQYIASIITVFIVGIVRYQEVFFDVGNFYIGIVGVILSLGVTFLNKSMKISLSRTMIVNQFNGLVASLLAAIFLKEWQLFDPATLSGWLLLFSIITSIISILLMGKRGKQRAEAEKGWILWSSLGALLIGCGMFLPKLFVGRDHKPMEVLFFQYIFSLLTISILVMVNKVKINVGKKNTLAAFCIGVFMSVALTFLYEAFKLASMADVQTVQKIGVTIASILIGLFLFGEKRNLNRKVILGMLVGFVSIVLAVVSNLLRGIVEIGGEKTKITEGDLVVIPPNTKYNYWSEDGELEFMLYMGKH